MDFPYERKPYNCPKCKKDLKGSEVCLNVSTGEVICRECGCLVFKNVEDE
jgi:hypothetical protein